MIAHVPARHAVPQPQRVVHARTMPETRQMLRPGTRVSSDMVGTRTFFGDDLGVALGGSDRGPGQGDYPVRSTDGGRVWRIDGPLLYTDSADAPLAVSAVTASGPRVQYAYGDGGNVIDATSDGGRVWRQALFVDAVPIAVVPVPNSGALIAIVQSEADFRDVTTLQYVSRDGGATWRYSTVYGGGR